MPRPTSRRTLAAEAGRRPREHEVPGVEGGEQGERDMRDALGEIVEHRRASRVGVGLGQRRARRVVAATRRGRAGGRAGPRHDRRRGPARCARSGRARSPPSESGRNPISPAPPKAPRCRSPATSNEAPTPLPSQSSANTSLSTPAPCWRSATCGEVHVVLDVHRAPELRLEDLLEAAHGPAGQRLAEQLARLAGVDVAGDADAHRVHDGGIGAGRGARLGDRPRDLLDGGPLGGIVGSGIRTTGRSAPVASTTVARSSKASRSSATPSGRSVRAA